MQRLERFLTMRPSYVKWSAERIANRLNLSTNTVVRFKKTETYKNIVKNYGK